ncbi:MAG: S8 family serine peptidase [Arenimonas sp.]
MKRSAAPALLTLAIAASLGATSANAAALISKDLQSRLLLIGPHQVIVTWTDPAVATKLATISTRVRTLRQLPMSGAILTSAQVKQVAAWPGVESIYWNAPLELLNYEAGEITGGHIVHDQLGITGAGVTIAVIDSGIDATHPDLPMPGKVVQNVKIIGDLDLVGTTVFQENVPNTDTSSGHGTHVAGIAGGTGEASIGDARRSRYYAGIAPGSKLVGLGTGEGINILFALEGFDYALANQQRYGIDVITNSWGTSESVYDPNSPVNRASFEAYRRGMVVAFAAGNDGPGDDTINPYALVPWVISVGSGTKTGDLSDFSSRGVAGDPYKHVDLVAPGSDICSTRAPLTALGALGPVINADYPAYTHYYTCMSGTSMATPFVAGVAALLLEANPALSPDQVESILAQTAKPMAGYQYHQVGAGYIDVLRAVDLASSTTGTRQGFLQGVTAWSSAGQWIAVADANPQLAYTGTWTSTSLAGATDGVYRKASVSKKSVPRVDLAYYGQGLQLRFPRDSKGGVADVYVDGTNVGTINFYSTTATTGGRFAVPDLDRGLHVVQLRGVKGTVYFDGALTDGKLFATQTRLVDAKQTFTGTLGPSVENLEIDEFPIEVGADTIQIKATLGWQGGVDVDFALVDPDGVEVASGATLANPETLEFAVNRPGTYRYRVKGYATVLANYTLESTQQRAVVTPQ